MKNIERKRIERKIESLLKAVTFYSARPTTTA